MKGYRSGKIAYHPEVAFRLIDGEAVIITPRDGVMHTLNGVGTKVWAMLEKKPTFSELVDAVLESYQVKRDKVESDLGGFLQELLSKGMVELQDV